MTAAEHGKIIRNKILDFIVSYISENQYPPTVKEIGHCVGLKSTSTVVSHLIRLREEGKINYIDYQPRTITVPGYKFVNKNEIEITNSTCRYWNLDHQDCTLNYEEIRNKAIDECLSVLYRNGGKIISIRFYEQIFYEMKQLKGCGDNS